MRATPSHSGTPADPPDALPSIAVLRTIFVLSLAALGAFMPFLGGHLEALGFSGAELGLLMAMLPAGRVLTSPLWAAAADRWRIAGTLLRAGCALSAVGGGIALAADTALPGAVGLFLFAAGRAPLGPLVDSLTLRALSAAGRDPRDYGRIRAWGSVGFMVAAAVAALLPPGAATALAALLLVVNAGAAWLVPREGRGGPAPILPALRLLAGRPFLAPLLLTAALQALTLSVYDTFLSAHVHALGLGATVVAAAVAVGVTGETVLMFRGRWLLQRFGAARLLVIAAALGVPRWLATAYFPDPVALVAIQALHAVNFAAFWIAGVELMSRHAPARIAASAQSLFAAASYGLGALVGALLAGELRALAGTDAIFLGSAVVAVLATAAALWLERRERASDEVREPLAIVREHTEPDHE